MPQWFFDILGLIILFGMASITLVLILIISGARRFIKPPRYTAMMQIIRSLPIDPAEMGLKYEILELPPEKNKDDAWLIPGQLPQRPAIIYIHPWSSSRHEITHLLPYMVQHCSKVLLTDIPGHGDSKNGYTANVSDMAPFEHLIQQHSEHAGVILMGRGLGANMAINLAHTPGVCGLVIDELAPANFPIRVWYHSLKLPNMTSPVTLLLRIYGFKVDSLNVTQAQLDKAAEHVPMLEKYTFSREPEKLERLEAYLKQFDTPPPGENNTAIVTEQTIAT